MNHSFWRTILLLPLLLAGCVELQFDMRYGVEALPPEQLTIWPSPPETPRYQYAGQLTGFENFLVKEESKPQGAHEALMWIVGFDVETERRRVMPKGVQRPQGGVVDNRGRIMVTDISQRAVLVFDEQNGKLLVWSQARADGSPFVSPVGIAVGFDGRLLVTDSELGSVVMLTPDGAPLGEFGQGQLTRPTGIARDPWNGRIYVSDTREHVIRVFDDLGNLVRTIGVPGDQPGEFNAPTHITFVDGKLYVADTLNARIQIIDADTGGVVRTFGKRGLRVGNFVRPKGIAVDLEGNIYVVESFHDHLLIFNKNGEFLLPIGGTGSDPGQFFLPSGVWTDRRGRVFVADMFNGRVEIFQFLGGGG